MQKILVPIDFTEHSRIALTYAIDFISKETGELHIFHAFNFPAPPEGGAIANYMNAAIVETETVLKAKVQDFIATCENWHTIENNPKVKVIETVSLGSVVEEIQQLAEQHEIDLVVMGTGGHRGLEKILLGSVAEATAQAVPTPVLIVPRNARYRAVKQICCTLDFEADDEEKIVAEILAFAKPLNAAVTCLHITKEQEYIDEFMEEVALRNKILADTFRYEKQSLSFEVKVSNYTAPAIEAYIAQTATDIVAVYHRKRSFLDNIFHDSIAKSLLADSIVPVLVLK